MSREDPQMKIRLPDELKAKIEQAADEAGRSMNAEIVTRLQDSLNLQHSSMDVLFALTKLQRDVARAELQALRFKVEALKQANAVNALAAGVSKEWSTQFAAESSKMREDAKGLLAVYSISDAQDEAKSLMESLSQAESRYKQIQEIVSEGKKVQGATAVNQFSYRIYYEWKGPTHSDPFATTSKTQDEIEAALRNFASEFKHRLPELEAKIESSAVAAGSKEVTLHISTTATQEEVERALIPTLQNWKLFGDDLSKKTPR